MPFSLFDGIKRLGDGLLGVIREIWDSAAEAPAPTQAPPAGSKPQEPPAQPAPAPKRRSEVAPAKGTQATPAKRTPRSDVGSPPRQLPPGSALQRQREVELVRPPTAKELCVKYGLYPFEFAARKPAELARDTRQAIKARFFRDQIVGATGYGPFPVHDMHLLIRRLGGIPDSQGVWQAEQLIIIGQKGFDTDYLRRSIEVGLEMGFTCRYISQESLTGLLLAGQEPEYYHGDSRIREHTGLHYLATLGFEWPSQAGAPGDGPADPEHASGWRLEHELRHIYGYTVNAREGLTSKQRLERLGHAVAGLGLQSVAEHIAWLIRNAKHRRGDQMQVAIEKWEDDMDWLHDTFYTNSIYRFIWPGVYRGRKKNGTS